jgi:amino acid adenylation domain-containing protein
LGSVSITYRSLVGGARRVARRLLEAGAAPDEFVGVTVDRSLAAVVGVLGAVMAGTAYVPIGADLPLERARTMVKDASIRVLTGRECALIAKLCPVWVPVSMEPEDSADEAAFPHAEPLQAAYAIFTSGSTGKPKGVVVPYRAVVNSTLARFGVYPHDDVRYLMLAPLTIDAAVAGLYFTLAAGGRLVIPTSDEVLDPQLLAELLLREQVSHLDGLPSQYAPLLRFHAGALGGLRCVILGGEPLPATVLREHFAAVPQARLHNEYGPTEGTVWSTSHRCAGADDGPRVPIGQPAPGVRAKVLNTALDVVGAGIVGEICIAGTGLARCYLNRAALTAECFVPDPDPQYPGERMYRTGDLGSVTRAGHLVYHGRTDHLVKVRGFRVELGEVEARLREHPDIVEAAVVPNASMTGVRLTAVVAIAPGSVAGVRALAAFVADSLPRYMVPTRWRRVGSLPLTENGKMDRLLLQSQATTVGSALPAGPDALN